MAASVLRPLAVRLHHAVRFHSKVFVQSRQNRCSIFNRGLWTSVNVRSNNVVNISASPIQEPGEKQLSSWTILFQELQSLGSVEEVLAVTSQRELSGNEASIVVSVLRRIHQDKMTPDQGILADERFQNLSTLIAKGVKKLSNESLTSALTNTLHLQTQDDEFILALEGECRRRLRLLPIRYLTVIVCNDQLLSGRAETKALVNEAARVLELRWREIDNRQLVRRLLPAAARVSKPLLERMEDKTLEMLNQYSFQEIAGLTKSLAATKTRSLPILRAVSYQLSEQRSHWEIAPLMDIMSYMGTLGFHNPALFNDFASHITQKIDECPVRLLCDIAKTYAVLRFQATDLFDLIHRAAAASVDELLTLDLKRLLFAYSQFRYQPPNAEAFYDQVERMLSARLQEYSPSDQIDLVHSLALLQKAPESLLGKVLQLGAGDRDGLAALPSTPKLKLMQINSYAELELQSYQGPKLTPELKTFPSDRQLFTTSLHRSVITALTASLQGDQFIILESVKCDRGYVFDAEISSSVEGNGQKMAIVTLGPPCYLYSSRQLIGRLEMMLRHLRLSGYQVLEIPYHDWYPLRTPVQQITYLKERLGQLLD